MRDAEKRKKYRSKVRVKKKLEKAKMLERREIACAGEKERIPFSSRGFFLAWGAYRKPRARIFVSSSFRLSKFNTISLSLHLFRGPPKRQFHGNGLFPFLSSRLFFFVTLSPLLTFVVFFSTFRNSILFLFLYLFLLSNSRSIFSKVCPVSSPLSRQISGQKRGLIGPREHFR